MPDAHVRFLQYFIVNMSPCDQGEYAVCLYVCRSTLYALLNPFLKFVRDHGGIQMVRSQGTNRRGRGGVCERASVR